MSLELQTCTVHLEAKYHPRRLILDTTGSSSVIKPITSSCTTFTGSVSDFTSLHSTKYPASPHA
ncbi:hypothetical protein HanRHA438_Chr12g0542311 [Helianthus annuus]|nr:hypothetical protein HanRHA438_Chr12g0542311 [Helianthus annuus]